VFVVLVSVPEIFAGDPLLAAPPVNPGVMVGIGQLYVVPAGTVPFGPLTGVTLNPVPLHTDVGMSVIAAFGFTVTVNVNELPAQVPEVGVTV
jgi:hypothetical protein